MPTEIDFSDEGSVIVARPPGAVNFGDDEGTVIVARPRRKKAGGPAARVAIPLPIEDPDAWDTMKVAGVPMPGVVKVDGAGHGRRTSSSEAPGTNGAKTTDTGRKAKKIKITVLLGWELGHLDQMREILKLVFRSVQAPTPPAPPTGPAAPGTPPPPDNTLYLPLNTLGPQVLDPAYSTRKDGGLALGEQEVTIFEPFGRSVMDPSTLGPVNPAAQFRPPPKAVETPEQKAKMVPAPVDVDHPALRIFDIRSLYFLEVDMKLQDNQILEFTFDCVDFISPGKRKATVGTAKGSASSAAGGWDSIQSAITVGGPTNWKP